MKVLAEIEGGKGVGDKHKEALNPTLLHMASWVVENAKYSSAARRIFSFPRNTNCKLLTFLLTLLHSM